MAPLSETEIMTLKRLEVAIRKMDFKLLKSGAYKLHEKFHSGHKFEYTDLLKEIYSNIASNSSIPKDIKDILIPTIEDILEAQSIVNDTKVDSQKKDEKRVSSLTSLSYNAKAINEANSTNENRSSVSTLDSPVSNFEDKKINAYDAFGTQKAGVSDPNYKPDFNNNAIENVISDSRLEAEMLNDTLGVQMDTITPIQNEIMSSINADSPSFETENETNKENSQQTFDFSQSSSFVPFSLGSDQNEENQAENIVEPEDEVEKDNNELMPTPTFEITANKEPEAVENIIEPEIEKEQETKLEPEIFLGRNIQSNEEKIEDETIEKRVDDIASSITQNISQNISQNTAQNIAQVEPVLNSANNEIEENKLPTEAKSVSIFFSQDSSREKIKNITMYRELISKLRNEHISLDETLRLISEIRVQSDTNVMELRNILNQFKFLDNKINLITNSSSSNLTYLLDEMGLPFSFIKSQEDTNLTLNPLFGLSNLFTCPNCSETYLDTESKLEPLILTCPKCKSPMYPTFYTVDGVNVELNSNYYNYALQSLANSKIWLLIHPALGDVFTINMFKTALNISNSVEEIYILDKDINVRETYNSALSKSIAKGRKVFIDTQMNALEIFFKSIKK